MVKLFKSKKKDAPDGDLRLLAVWMAGVFNNQEQARNTQSYNYISLHTFPIWQERLDGFWFYVEQTMTDQPDQPYRQRVYHLSRINKDLIENKIFAIQNGSQFVRAYERPEILQNLALEMLVLRPGCSLILRRINPESFAGSTLGEGCPSELRGAMYTTSQIVINEKQMINWERGYDRGGKQVWGATMGGYIFTKLKAYEL
jgi:CpeT protein